MPSLPVFSAPSDPVFLVVAREDVDQLRVADLILTLQSMAATRESSREYDGRLTLCFDGYCDDARELYAIPAVRAFVQSVNEKFSFWLHFCSKSDDTLFMVIACMLPLGKSVLENGLVSTQLLPGYTTPLLLKLFGALNELHFRHGYGSAETSVVTQQVGEYLRCYFSD